MFSDFLKSLSILKKFLFINLIIFLVIGSLTLLYIGNVKPNLIKNKTIKHIQIIDNTIDHILRLSIKFEEEDIRRFLFSTRFLFQNLDRVILFDNQFNLVGDTDTLDLDPRSFSNRLDIVQLETLNEGVSKKKIEKKYVNKKKIVTLNDTLKNYSQSNDYGKAFTFTQEEYDQQANFRLITYIPTDAQSSKLLGAKIVVNNAKSTVIGTTFESTWQFADPNTLTVQPYNAIKGRMRAVEANNALVFGFEDDGNNQAFSSGIKYTHIGLS